MSDRRGFCERHFGAYLVADGCPYCEPVEAVTVKTGWHDFKPAHLPGKLLTTAQKGLTLTPHARMEFVTAMLDHTDEDGNPAPMITRAQAVELLGGPADSALTPAQEADLERAAERAFVEHTGREMARGPAPETWCPECGTSMTVLTDSFLCNANCWNGEDRHFAAHEVWRRWGDTDKATGEYWIQCEDFGLSKPGVLFLRDGIDTYDMRQRDHVRVLGPIPQPKVPR